MSNIFSIVIINIVLVIAVEFILHWLYLPTTHHNVDVLNEQEQMEQAKNQVNGRMQRLNEEIALLQTKVEQLEQAVMHTQSTLHTIRPDHETASLDNANDTSRPSKPLATREQALQQRMHQEGIDEKWE